MTRPIAPITSSRSLVLHAWVDGAIKNNGNKDGSGIAIGGVGGVYATADGEVLADLQERFKGTTAEVTNNRMELLAAILALESLPGLFDNLDEVDVVSVHSDSAYVVNGINKHIGAWIDRNWHTRAGAPVKNQDLWERLDAISGSNALPSVEFVKTSGHKGIELNERADILATQAVRGEWLDDDFEFEGEEEVEEEE